MVYIVYFNGLYRVYMILGSPEDAKKTKETKDDAKEDDVMDDAC